ncbi:carbohydrate ABC transporter substrate-binding protein (CUT1 family) [Aliiruegeria haliotis]|uniref:Carbohydrate ABC transporter substrate-binding protein (CUT1 family) n=1 Tax=Aliiruegeria haliotis TaxID=1280846 RepID=A0A2T0RLY8_9RHOB|nr:sugar ABC transporter substrate-binding protein [Aliiruegeria haliotis]PRY22188.1 carbohydrate ABC transporter substrate-binding protein (CUT1 family) [Aliiruegeria haliotis]
MKLKARLLAGALVSAAALAAPATAQELRFTVWSGNEAHLNMLNEIADSFIANHEGVTVRFETIPFSEYTQKITLQQAGGNVPDLGWLLETAAPSFVNAGVLLDVADVLKSTDGYDYDDLAKPAQSLWVRDDAVYGIPFSTSPFMTFFNKDLFAAAGVKTPVEHFEAGTWNYETFRETAKATTSDAAFGFQTKDGAGFDARIMQFLEPAIYANGGDVWADGECLLNSPEAVEAVTTLHEMIFVDKSIVPPGEQDDFFAGGAAMTSNQISRTSKLKDASFEWGIAPLPAAADGSRADIIGQAAIVAFANGKNTELAAEFVAHMTNTENTARMAEFFPPIRASVLASDSFTSSNALLSEQEMAWVADAISSGTVLASHEKFAQIMAAAKPRFDGLWRPDADVGAVLNAVCDAIKPHL